MGDDFRKAPDQEATDRRPMLERIIVVGSYPPVVRALDSTLLQRVELVKLPSLTELLRLISDGVLYQGTAIIINCQGLGGDVPAQLPDHEYLVYMVILFETMDASRFRTAGERWLMREIESLFRLPA